MKETAPVFFFFFSSWLLVAIIGQKKLLEMCKKPATMWCLLHCFLPVIFKLCRVMFGLLSWHDWGGGGSSPFFESGVKSALEVTVKPVTSSPGVGGNDPRECKIPHPTSHRSHLLLPCTDIQHNTQTHTLLNLEELRRVWPGGG